MNFEYIDQARKKAHISIDVSEYHGKIAACLCCDNISAEDLLPEEINADGSSLSSETMELKTVLVNVIAETLEKLNDAEMTRKVKKSILCTPVCTPKRQIKK